MIDGKGSISCDVCKKAQATAKGWYTIAALPAAIDLRRTDAKIDPERPSKVTLYADAEVEAVAVVTEEEQGAPEARFDVCDECVNDRVLGNYGHAALAAMGMTKT